MLTYCPLSITRESTQYPFGAKAKIVKVEFQESVGDYVVNVRPRDYRQRSEIESATRRCVDGKQRASGGVARRNTCRALIVANTMAIVYGSDGVCGSEVCGGSAVVAAVLWFVADATRLGQR